LEKTKVSEEKTMIAPIILLLGLRSVLYAFKRRAQAVQPVPVLKPVPARKLLKPTLADLADLAAMVTVQPAPAPTTTITTIVLPQESAQPIVPPEPPLVRVTRSPNPNRFDAIASAAVLISAGLSRDDYEHAVRLVRKDKS
jgi:hypothetical protein